MEDLISSSSGSEVDFESDDDYLYNSNHNSETEEDNIDSDVCEDSYKYCYSKDGKTKWNMECPTQKRTRSHNIISCLPGVKSHAKNAKSPLESLKLFISPNITYYIFSFKIYKSKD
ncbi:uncharacterized protein LOC135930070 [Gordionus sp. m RMFG-2023]|uniref:uncharacterized protein LOC135930070 n=1 Tax=Gordionus sp. m RMFG-2023 TaxID=3053472 RepID=UPI0031FD3F25